MCLAAGMFFSFRVSRRVVEGMGRKEVTNPADLSHVFTLTSLVMIFSLVGDS